MNSVKRERNATMSSMTTKYNQYNYNANNGKVNGRHRTTSSPNPYANTNGSTTQAQTQEKGIVEKLLSSYGFVECASNGSRVFFHYSEFAGDPNDLVVGDSLQFSLTNDPRNNKLLAVNLSKLPPGSVTIETLTEEECIGRVEVEPTPLRNGETNNPATYGRVSYDKQGEFFFLPFSMNDIQNGENISKGDTVSFVIGTNKRTGSLKARKLKYVDARAQVKAVQGIISSLKETFGFIERADIVAEIYFHYSEYDGEVNELMIGDDVEFQLQNRANKELAVCVKKLPTGTVILEDVSTTTYKGHVIKSVNNRNLNSSCDGTLSGVIEYQGKTDTHEIIFGGRDSEDDILLQKGDVVEFNISTDRRDNHQRAVNIKLISVALKDGQKRSYGVIGGLKEGFGFIKCVDREQSLFFHFSEVMEQSHIINIGDDVEYTMEVDPISRRQHATRIRFLPKGSVQFETVAPNRIMGYIEQEAPERSMKSPSKLNKEQEFGQIIAYLDNQEQIRVLYKMRECRMRENPKYRDKVEFNLITKTSTNTYHARDIAVIEKYDSEYERGFICALKDTFGFIETEDHSRELFFHYSELEGDPNKLELGDVVQYIETRKSDKMSAEKVSKLNIELPTENVNPTLYDGIVLRTMRIIDPEQDEYQGLIELAQDDCKNDEKQSPTSQKVYPFGITSMLKMKEPLQIGDKVTFQTYYDSVSKRTRATNISCKRCLLRGKVESVKGQFGFITYNWDEKSVFFHMSEVLNDHGKEIQPGDEVSFVIVKSHKNAKRSAVRVQKVVDERPEHLTRRRSNKMNPENNVNKFCVIRQPKGPEGAGFQLERTLSNTEEIKEQISAIEITDVGET